MKIEDRHIIAERGKVFRRISDGDILGADIWLGYTYYLNGKLLNEPLLELPEHFEEIDAPDNSKVIVDNQGDNIVLQEEIEETVIKITANDIIKMQEQVSRLNDMADYFIKINYGG
jgi:hypothetical protein